MLTCRGKLDAIGGSVGALPERDVFSGGYVRPMQLLVGVCGPVTIPAGKIPYRIGQDLTVAFSAAPESSQQIQGSTAHEIGDSPDSALSLSLSGFLVTLGRRGGSSAIDEAHTEQPVWDGSVRVRTEGPRGGSACVTQVRTVQV